MRIEVREKNEKGDINTIGELNPTEVNFLVQFAINHLMARGIKLELEEAGSDEDGADLMRIKMPDGTPIH